MPPRGVTGGQKPGAIRVKQSEIKTAINELKFSKSSDPNDITAKVQKADPETISKQFEFLFWSIWDAINKEIQIIRKEGVIAKLPKRGEL